MRVLRELALALCVPAVLAGAGCGSDASAGDRGRVERLLGARLPSDVDEVRYFRWHPSSQISFSTAYVELDGQPGALLSVPRRLGLHRYGEAGARRYLPTGWRTQPGVKLGWWDATTATPRRAWAARFGVDGSIVAKLERGRLYVIVTDTGLAGRK